MWRNKAKQERGFGAFEEKKKQASLLQIPVQNSVFWMVFQRAREKKNTRARMGSASHMAFSHGESQWSPKTENNQVHGFLIEFNQSWI